jgi:hypothetical protein
MCLGNELRAYVYAKSFRLIFWSSSGQTEHSSNNASDLYQEMLGFNLDHNNDLSELGL